MKSRLAPTPSGFLHIGNLYAFAFTWLTVRKHGGQLLLRIDDIDNERCRPEYLHNIFEWLTALGLPYDEGPKTAEDFLANWSQQLRLPLYEQLLKKLVKTGLVYACNCSRKTILETPNATHYPGTCRHKNIALEEPGVNWRLHIPEHTIVTLKDTILGTQQLYPATLMGDFIIKRRNGLPSYQVASLADDLHFGINSIIRGEDLLASTAAQLYMAQLISAPAFLATPFSHHPLIKNESGEKFSKSAGHAAPAQQLNQALVQETLEQLAHLLGISPGHQPFSSISDLLNA